jgi:hypothetical protein
MKSKHVNYKNSKHQKTNLKQIPMTEIQNSKQEEGSQDRGKVIKMFG